MQVHVLVSAADDDPERLERTTAALRAELLELDKVLSQLARRREEYTAELVIGDDKIVVTGISAATQDRLIDVWLRAHALDRVGED